MGFHDRIFQLAQNKHKRRKRTVTKQTKTKRISSGLRKTSNAKKRKQRATLWRAHILPFILGKGEQSENLGGGDSIKWENFIEEKGNADKGLSENFTTRHRSFFLSTFFGCNYFYLHESSDDRMINIFEKDGKKPKEDSFVNSKKPFFLRGLPSLSRLLWVIVLAQFSRGFFLPPTQECINISLSNLYYEHCPFILFSGPTPVFIINNSSALFNFSKRFGCATFSIHVRFCDVCASMLQLRKEKKC